MSETLLKKEFQPKDLNRIRNLVRKDFTQKTVSSTGYNKGNVVRYEGDVWEEDGRKWTIKDGIKQNITKLNVVKDLIRIPLRCPKCSGPMNHWLAKKMYRIHGFCFDPCTVEYEADLRRVGLFEQYEKRMLEGNVKAFAEDLENWITEYPGQKDTFVTEQGDIEDWNNNQTSVDQKEVDKVKKIVEHLQAFLNK
jgi:hypothetical protein